MLEIEKGVDTHETKKHFDDYADQSADRKLSGPTRTGGQRGRSKRAEMSRLTKFPQT